MMGFMSKKRAITYRNVQVWLCGELWMDCSRGQPVIPPRVDFTGDIEELLIVLCSKGDIRRKGESQPHDSWSLCP